MNKWAVIGMSVIAFKISVKYAWAIDIRADIRAVKSQYPHLSYVPEGLVVAIAKVESNLDPSVTGADGEYGLMQIMPFTFDWLFTRYGLGVPVFPYLPFVNVLGGMLYLDTYYGIYKNWFDVIHVYNVGAGNYDNGVRNWDYFTKVLSWWGVA
uniref:Putative transglycosylase n=1 Tax=viral metagenome TaxID=1070528 RepID=A0A6M3LHV1_9ZZZZ